MTAIFRTLAKVFALSFFAMLLSSCANNTNFSSFPDFFNADSPEYDTLDTDTLDTDTVELETVESKVCLDEELNALSQTGGWSEELSSTKVEPEDTVVYDFPVVLNKQVDMYLNLFQNSQRREFRHWLAKSAMYRPMIEKELEEAGLPKDLFYLAMIESGFNQLACSNAHAVGLWQFMRPTGKQYNLRVDKYVDERRDPFKSTKAAVTYLSDLYKEFDDWFLAVAAYNGGPGTIRSGLRRLKVDNFWDLASKRHLRLETKRYVPKLIAALLIAKNPEKYGFENINYQKPLEYETLTVGPGMSLDAIALISNSSTKEIKRLNLELKLGKTPLNRAKYDIKIPQSKLGIAKRNLTRLHSIVSTGYKIHRIAKGDTLRKICRRYGINKATLSRVNKLHNGQLAYGQKLKIPYSTIIYRLLPEGSPGAMAAYKDSLVLHRIKKGDTVSKIARMYKVPQKMIIAWNDLRDVRSIRPGQQLALYIDHRNGNGEAHSSSVTAKPSGNTIRLVAEKTYKKILQQPENDSPYEWYSVQHGDSLWTISRKFSATTAEIKKWNNLTSDDIYPGSMLKLKKV